MPTREQVEKVRQEIMRFRELLDIMRDRLESGEQAYGALFADLPSEDMALKEKDRQWKAAEQVIDDLTPLSNAVGRMHFDAHELERSFSELYGVIVTPDETDDEE